MKNNQFYKQAENYYLELFKMFEINLKSLFLSRNALKVFNISKKQFTKSINYYKFME